jgi:hypothetical protein
MSGLLDPCLDSPVGGVLPTPSNPPPVDLSTISFLLTSLAKAISHLSSSPPTAVSAPSTLPTDAPTQEPTLETSSKPSCLLSTLSCNAIIKLLHYEGSVLPSVELCDTANASDTKTHWKSEELHRAMGCQTFWNYKHLLQVSRDGEWMDGGKFPSSLGSYAMICKANSGGQVDRLKYKYLGAVHIDIAFGNCLSVGGFWYALVLVDHATRYNWVFGLKNLSSDAILSAIWLSCAAAGSLAKCFYCNCDLKLFGTAISEYLINNQSKVVATPVKSQSSNGLVESPWKTMVHMACAYLTKTQMPRTFWFYAITHLAWMMNAIPGTYLGHLASPFLLIHGIGHDKRTWIPLFSFCYFHLDKDSDQHCSKHQAHTMDSIVIGRSPTSNALLVYNPRNRQYYEPNSYYIDPYHLPTSIYPGIKYDGGLFCYLLCNGNPHMEEKYPPGTRIERVDPSSNMLLSGTVMDIPFPPMSTDSAPLDLSYTVLFNNGTTASIPLRDMASLIPPPPVNPSSSGDILSSQDSLLPPFLRLNLKITYEHDGQYYKGFLTKRDGSYSFPFKSHARRIGESIYPILL